MVLSGAKVLLHPALCQKRCVSCFCFPRKKTFFYEKMLFSHFALLYGSARVEPDHENHQFSWKTMIFIDFISFQFSPLSYLRVPWYSTFTHSIMLLRIHRFARNLVKSLYGIWNTLQAIHFCSPGLIMGRNRWSTQNRGCKWKVFGALAATQIQATRQTSWIMGLKSVRCNDAHRCWYNCAKSPLTKYSNSLKNDIKVRILHSKTLNFPQNHVKYAKIVTF